MLIEIGSYIQTKTFLILFVSHTLLTRSSSITPQALWTSENSPKSRRTPERHLMISPLFFSPKTRSNILSVFAYKQQGAIGEQNTCLAEWRTDTNRTFLFLIYFFLSILETFAGVKWKPNLKSNSEGKIRLTAIYLLLTQDISN